MDVPRPERKRGLRRVAIVVAGVLVALVVVFTVLLALVNSDAVVARVKDYAVPRVSERLGREVTVETARVKIFPKPRVTLGGVVVHGVGDEPPLVEAPETNVELKLWPLIRSFGNDIEVDRVALVKPEINLVRRPDGTWNFAGLGGGGQGQREFAAGSASVKDGTIRVIDRSGSRGEATVALTQIDASVSNFGEGRPLTLKGAAAFANDRQNVKVDLKTSPLVSGQLPDVKGRISLEGAQVPRLEGLLPARIAALTTGGQLHANARVSSHEGQILIDGDAQLAQLRLRGQPANGSFHLNAELNPKDLTTLRATITNLAVKGPGVELTGNARATMQPKRVEFALRGPLLDLDTLLGALPEQQPVNRSAMLPARVRSAIEQVDVRGTLQVSRVIKGKLSAENLDAVAVLDRGVLRLEKAGADFYGGKVDASGTTVVLTQKIPTWNLTARLSGVDVGTAMQSVSGSAPLQGRVDAAMKARGEGADWAHLRENLNGTAVLALKDGALTTTDLGAKLAEATSEALRLTGQSGAATTAEYATGKTELGDLTANFNIQNGAMVLREPMAFTSPFGGGRLDGKIGLDQSLALKGTVVLAQPFLATTIGRTGVTPPALEVPLEISGTLKDPVVSVSPTAIAQSLAKGGAQAAQKTLEETVKRQARKGLGDVFKQLGGP